MSITVILVNLVYAIMGVVLMFASYRLIDKLTPEINFPGELKRGNIAAGIFIAAIFIGIAIIVGSALN